MSTETTPDPDDTLDAASRSLFHLGRVFSRLPRRDLFAPNTGQDPDLGAILIAQTVAAAQSNGHEITVGALADHLAIDPSTASRLVARAVRNGLLRRVATQADGRVITLHLTPAGHALAAAAAHYQRTVFDTATHGWSTADRQTFARLFIAFAAAVTTLTPDS